MVCDVIPRKIEEERTLSALKVATAVQPNAHLADVGTLSFLADGVELQSVDAILQLGQFFPLRCSLPQPTGLLDGGIAAGLRPQTTARVRLRGCRLRGLRLNLLRGWANHRTPHNNNSTPAAAEWQHHSPTWRSQEWGMRWGGRRRQVAATTCQSLHSSQVPTPPQRNHSNKLEAQLTQDLWVA